MRVVSLQETSADPNKSNDGRKSANFKLAYCYYAADSHVQFGFSVK